jgi:hypothetical protein
MLVLLGGVGLGLILFFPSIRNGSARVLFRALVPAWRYFDREEPVPALYLRRMPSSSDQTAAGNWQKVPGLHNLRPFDFLCNPSGNLVLLEDSLLRLWLTDESALKSWIRERVRQEAHERGFGLESIQYRVDLEDPVSGRTVLSGVVLGIGGTRS